MQRIRIKTVFRGLRRGMGPLFFALLLGAAGACSDDDANHPQPDGTADLDGGVDPDGALSDGALSDGTVEADAEPDIDGGQTAAVPVVGGCAVFPFDNPWNTDISNAPVDPNSDALIASIGLDGNLHADFGTTWQGVPNGIPFVVVGPTQPAVPVSFDYADESDPGPYPIPPDAPIEGGPDGTGDRHVLVLQSETCLLYELFNAWPERGGGWHAGSGALFDLSTNALRPDTWTSADAAGLPILPGLVKYDEAAAGEIRHALRFTVEQSRRAFVHPATHWASSEDSPDLPPMGMRVRLKADFDVSPFSSEVQAILEAMKRYGMFVADNGSDWFVSGAPDERWDDDALHDLHNVTGDNFEVVEMGHIYTPADF
jgi:hypothetical protein